MVIDATKKYRTRCGYSVRIYATDGAKPYAVHGAVFASARMNGSAAQSHGWVLEAWHSNGRSAASDDDGVDHFLDLVEIEESEIEESANETPAANTAAANC